MRFQFAGLTLSGHLTSRHVTSRHVRFFLELLSVQVNKTKKRELWKRDWIEIQKSYSYSISYSQSNLNVLFRRAGLRRVSSPSFWSDGLDVFAVDL